MIFFFPMPESGDPEAITRFIRRFVPDIERRGAGNDVHDAVHDGITSLQELQKIGKGLFPEEIIGIVESYPSTHQPPLYARRKPRPKPGPKPRSS